MTDGIRGAAEVDVSTVVTEAGSWPDVFVRSLKSA